MEIQRVWRVVVMAGISLTTIVAMGCTTQATKQDRWPTVDVLPKQLPKGLNTKAAASVLKRGEDGFLYIVGGLDAKAGPGSTFLARYGGQWPLESVRRPPLAAGQIVKRYGKDVALVHMMYTFPDIELDKLEITWQSKNNEDVGKGVGVITKLKPNDRSDVELSLGKGLGVQVGDIYALYKPKAGAPTSNQHQFARRLAGVCMINAVRNDRSTCRLWRGSGLHPSLAKLAPKDAAVFLEHTFGAPPRRGVVQFAQFENDPGGVVHKTFVEQMKKYVSTHAQANVEVESLKLTANAQETTFYRNEYKVKYKGMPQLFVGGTLKKVNGKTHLFLNYTGIGPASGPGMIAAPPEGGVDLGPPGEIDGKQLRQVFGVLWSAMLIYRGQTSEALLHLRQMMDDVNLTGALRWHARDQFAMRWAALGYVDEALWMVLEDETLAVKSKNKKAQLNALGTRVRLYDMLKQKQTATNEAKRYLDMRQNGSKSALLSAQGMYAEMLMSQDKLEEAKAVIKQMEEACPQGCSGDLFSLLSGVYWSVGPKHAAYQKTLLEKMGSMSDKLSVSAKASLWIYRGIELMRNKEISQALIAFLEAERLFKQRKSLPGVARTKYFIYLCHLALKDPFKAYENAVAVLKLADALNDYSVARNIYDRLSGIYNALDPKKSPQAYLKLVSRIYTAIFESQIATGQVGKASETLLAIGNFYFRSGGIAEAKGIFQKAIIYAIRSTRFDVAAMGHLTLGIIARAQRDATTFRKEIERAQVMAKLSGDPQVLETIKRILSPPKEDAPKIDSKFL